MTDPEHFLSRWARKKSEEQSEEQREEKRQAVEPPGPAANAAPAAALPQSEGTDKPGDGRAPAAEHKPAASAPAFDPLSLPSIDSIGAQTDISAFLKPGVPSELRLAALRRAWSMDPAIRDFKGLQENDWNFNDPNGIPGFGELDPGVDVKKMVAQLFGETPRADEKATEIPAPAEQLTPPSNELSAPTGRAARDSEISDAHRTETTEKKEMVQREENIAARDDDAELDDAQIKRRRSQGSALPH
jgi:hypothetical protein